MLYKFKKSPLNHFPDLDFVVEGSATDLLVYPNPANTILNLVVNLEDVTKVILYDITGNIVYIEQSLFHLNTVIENH